MDRERAKVERHQGSAKLTRSKNPKLRRAGCFFTLIFAPAFAILFSGLLFVLLPKSLPEGVGEFLLAVFLFLLMFLQMWQFFPRKHKPTFEQIDEQEFLKWAREKEYETTPTDYDLIQLLEPLGIFGQYRPVFIGVRGEREGLPFWIGRLTIFNDGLGGESQALLDDMVAVYRLPYRFEDTLLVEPTEASQSLLRDFFELPRVPFESEEFNTAYTAHSDTPSFAHACITPLVMEELLRWPNMELLLRSGLLVVNAADSHHLSRIGAERLEGLANAFLATLPSYLKEESDA